MVVLSEDARQAASEGDRGTLSSRLTKLLEEVNSVLPSFEQLAFIAVAKDEWSAENGFLTPTLKIKRQVLDAVYGQLAKKWYEMKQPVVWQATV